MLLTNRARAYVYHGQWVADCPAGCGATEALFEPRRRLFRGSGPRRRGTFHCSNCHLVAGIEWAADEADIMAALDQRPNPGNRNWYPTGHDVAIRAGIPHGQTPAELVAETHEHGSR